MRKMGMLALAAGVAVTTGLACGRSKPSSLRPSPPAPPACEDAARVAALTGCLATQGPDACESAFPPAGAVCDRDVDLVDDDLERALANAYSPVFAMNAGGFGGNPETHWPANTDFMAGRSRLLYRGNAGSAVVLETASLAAIAGATVDVAGARAADDPRSGQAADMWLCLKDHLPATLVSTTAAMFALPGGIDLWSVVHGANGTPAESGHYFVSYTLFWTYNEYATVDNHEGDSETVAVFVDRASGAVDAAWFDRHDSSDQTRFVDVATFGAHDPAGEVPHGDLNGVPRGIHGLRFADYGGVRHRLVVYVSTGGHAMYDYPANTYVISPGPRDTHDGDGAQILTATTSALFAASVTSTAGTPLLLQHVMPGESTNITVDWARYRGQWGCDDATIGKSYPLPFGNARHARPLYDRKWGSPPHG